MPYLSKRVISNYFRTNCLKQLRLLLSPHNQKYEPERAALGMPPKSVGRAGIAALTQEGSRWEQDKLQDLLTTFGPGVVIGVQTKGDFQDQKLLDVIGKAKAGDFVVRPGFEVTNGGAFQTALKLAPLITKHQLGFANCVPDLIQVLAADQIKSIVNADGTVSDPDGRLGLRVIDIKMTAQPSASYFAEITYYSLALAGWLVDHGLDEQFAVVAEAAIWPGSHEASSIVKLRSELSAQGLVPSVAQLNKALEEDIETLEIDVFAPRLRHFFHEELKEALDTPWNRLDYHVGTSCSGCEYLGYSWSPNNPPHPDHCMPTAAKSGHLSSIAFLPRGARRALGDIQLDTAQALAPLNPDDSAFDSHPKLRATRTVVSGRANSLQSGISSIPQQAGTSAIIPGWSDLNFYISADFDVGSGITLAFGVSGFSYINKTVEFMDAQVFVNDTRAVQSETRELLAFLTFIEKALADAAKKDPNARVQFYLWDDVTYQHLLRVIGRNLTQILSSGNLKKLAWLFPPEEVLPNAKLNATDAPISIVRNAVQALVAAPIPHYYSLLMLAREYRPPAKPGAKPFNFEVPAIFEDPLSDQVPSERAHEIWTRMGAPRPWSQQVTQLRTTVTTKLRAMSSVVQRLRQDLQGQLKGKAPKISEIKSPSLMNGVSADGQIWFAYAKLNAQASKLERNLRMAMPVHEREARFDAARLEFELQGQARADAGQKLGIALGPGIRVYQLAKGSLEAKFEDGEFLCCVSPASDPNFFNSRVRDYTGGAPFPPGFPGYINEFSPAESLTKTKVTTFDRDNGLIALQFSPVMDAFLRSLGSINLSADVVLDKSVGEFLIRRLEPALRAIGNPPIAAQNGVATANVIGRAAPSKTTSFVPVADFLWDTSKMAGSVTPRDATTTRTQLEQTGTLLNPSQWDAWTRAMERRLALIWGPPGTGKTQTLRAILVGLVLDAKRAGRPIRVLVTSTTYDATDNVIVSTYKTLLKLGPGATGPLELVRLQTAGREEPAGLPAGIALNNDPNDRRVTDLFDAMDNGTSSVVMSATPQQVAKFVGMGNNAAHPLFDVVLIDEASQMDMANAVMALSPLANEGSVIVVGDPKQLPPIKQVDAPLGLEALVGSVYQFVADWHHVPSQDLLQNYRSNSTIVSLARFAGYPAGLKAEFPDLRIKFESPLPTTTPGNWPSTLAFSDTLTTLLEPSHPISAFIYPEGRSSQWNDFEAQTVASMIWLLRHHLSASLAGDPEATAVGPCDPEHFWTRAVGVVTPHRAHKALIVSKLQALFVPLGDDPLLIRNAVNTVERFQGQQRDVIIASYALGDPDAVSDEDEFLLSLNRFNVMASRPRAKLVVLASQEVINHLPGDLDVMRDSRLLKYFAETFLDQRQPVTMPFNEGGKANSRSGSLRFRQ